MREEYLIRYRRGGSFLRPFIVAAPRPYVVDLSGFVDAEGARSGLLAQVEALRSALAALGIGEVEAYRRGYSLNAATQGDLRYRVSRAGRPDLSAALGGIAPQLDDGWMRPVEGDEPETDHYEVESVHLGRMALPFIVAPATQTAQAMLSAIAGWQPPGRSGPIPPQLERRVLARRPARNQTTFPLPSEDCPSLPSCRGLFVLYPDGNMEWKDRGYIITSGLYFVRDDDPAIKALDWMDYSCR